MTITTIARLHRVAYSRVLGEQGTSACLYLGAALALATLDPVANASAISRAERRNANRK